MFAFVASILMAVGAQATHSTFSYGVDQFEYSDAGGFEIDDFSGPTLDDWHDFGGGYGSHTLDSDAGVLYLHSPGTHDDLLDPFLGMTLDRSDVFSHDGGRFTPTPGTGGFSGITTWTTGLPTVEGDYFGLGFNFLNSIGQVEIYLVGAIYMPADAALLAGTPSGLIVAQTRMVLSGPDLSTATVVSLSMDGVSVDPNDLTGGVLLGLIYNEGADAFQGRYSLSGLAALQSFPSSMQSTFSTSVPDLGSWHLYADPMFNPASVPEPRTTLLFIAGIAGLIIFEHKRVR